MATPAEPATDALYQALSSPNPDPQVVHTAIEEIRYLSAQNVIAVLGAKIDAQTARIDALGSRIDMLQKVIWPLIGLLTTTVFDDSEARGIPRGPIRTLKGR